MDSTPEPERDTVYPPSFCEPSWKIYWENPFVGVSQFEGYPSFQFIMKDGSRTKFDDNNCKDGQCVDYLLPTDVTDFYIEMISNPKDGKLLGLKFSNPD